MVILVLGPWLAKIPGVLVAVVAAIVASSLFDLGRHGVPLMGTLPQGFPPLTFPHPVSDLPLLIGGALGVALVALTETISTASSFAARTGQEIDGNQEMIGIGAANVAAGFFQGFNAEGISLVFAGLKDPVRAKLERYELIGPLEPSHFFPTKDAFRAQPRVGSRGACEGCCGESA